MRRGQTQRAGGRGQQALALIAAALLSGAVAAIPASGLENGAISARTYSLSARQAAEVTLSVRFLDAFNSRQLGLALSLVARDAEVTDCDFRTGRVVRFRGKREVERWLRLRFRDEDKMVTRRIFNENPSQPTGGLGIQYRRRTSATLRQLGLARGITPKVVTKVIFTMRGPLRIQRFANGPLGGSSEACRINS